MRGRQCDEMQWQKESRWRTGQSVDGACMCGLELQINVGFLHAMRKDQAVPLDHRSGSHCPKEDLSGDVGYDNGWVAYL